MLNSKVYDFLKYLTIIVLPAIGALYTGLAQIWNLPYSAQIPATITVICTFLGAILCISSAQYNKNQGTRRPYTLEEVDDDDEEGDA
jgi:hypothetical protein